MHIVILGNGITGVTAARHLRKRDPEVRITMVSGESDHFFSRPALMYVYMGHMRFKDILPYEPHFWSKNRIELKRGWVVRVAPEAHVLHFADGSTLPYDRLLLATGSHPNRFGWPGQDLDRVHGMYSLQDLIALERNTPHIRTGVIVGGGLIGIELAEMLHSRGKHAILLVRENSYWRNVLPAQESEMVNRAIRRSGIELRLSTELDHIVDDGHGAAGGIVTTDGTSIEAQFVGLTAGVRPNLSALEGSTIPVARGIVVDEHLRTKVPDIWAAGDCAHIHPENDAPYLEQVWYTGKAQGEVVAENLLGGSRAYRRATWFNSAKFLDIEYQIYGTVPSRPSEGVVHHYWEHPNGRLALRICTRDGHFIGLQTMGMRYRHRVCERWIQEGVGLAHVLDHLDEADFDPELYRRHQPAIRAGLREVPA